MKVCKAIIDDLNEIIDIYHIAVNHMFMENNTNQWSKDNTKFVRLVKKHIDNNEFFVVKNVKLSEYFWQKRTKSVALSFIFLTFFNNKDIMKEKRIRRNFLCGTEKRKR